MEGKDTERKKYKGFLYVKCRYCKYTRGLNARKPIDRYYCRGCGRKTYLEDMKPLTLRCKCGAVFRYRTNETERILEKKCLNCGAPVDLVLNRSRTAYETIQDEEY